MDYSVTDLMVDMGWISILMLVGSLARRYIGWFRALLIPAPITAGMLGLLLGPNVLDIIPFSEQLNGYTTLAIAIVFAALPFTMQLGGKMQKAGQVMFSYSAGALMLQWGVFIVLGIILFAPLFNTGDWFGMMLPVGFVGGFGVAAGVAEPLAEVGIDEAASLGFTAATVGTFSGIIGGIIFANWAARTGRLKELPATLPWSLRSGVIGPDEDRPVIGRATSNPSAIDPLVLHGSIVGMCIIVAYLINEGVNNAFPAVSIPLFAMAFVVAIVVVLVMKLLGKPDFADQQTMTTISGSATDYLIAFGIASIIPAAVADYLVPMILLFVLGILFCLVFFFFVAPKYFGEHWVERALFTWGWTNAAVATGIALLKIVDPHLKSGTMQEFGLGYLGMAPLEIGVIILAPIAVSSGMLLGLGVGSLVIGLVALSLAFIFGWHPGGRNAIADINGVSRANSRTRSGRAAES